MEWREVPDPILDTPEAALVRPVAVATCDIDRPIVRGDTPAPGPFPVGHEFVADVVEVGEAVRDLRPGDRVAVAFQISCGRCPRCRAGRTANCCAVPAGSAYGMGRLSNGLEFGGAVADLVRVPYADAMCLRLREDLAPAALAGLSDNLADGWRTVAPHLPTAAEAHVLVLGAGSIGLYATAIAVALGAEVTFVDPDENHCAIAERLGARTRQEPPTGRYESHPIVVHTGDRHGIQTAVRSTGSGGVCVNAAVFFENLVELPLLEMYAKGVTFITGRADARAAMPHALDLITSGRLDPSLFVAETAPWEDAPAAWTAHHDRLALVR
jgi:threonine dehydrogenase-like Zn-dependent dehydrogenase